jgi:hypothetical protein
MTPRFFFKKEKVEQKTLQKRCVGAAAGGLIRLAGLVSNPTDPYNVPRGHIFFSPHFCPFHAISTTNARLTLAL